MPVIPWNSAGLTNPRALRANQGYAVGDASIGGKNYAQAWNLATNARASLDSSNLDSSVAYGTGSGYVVGHDGGAAHCPLGNVFNSSSILSFPG